MIIDVRLRAGDLLRASGRTDYTYLCRFRGPRPSVASAAPTRSQSNSAWAGGRGRQVSKRESALQSDMLSLARR